jgi:hypothetical protein
MGCERAEQSAVPEPVPPGGAAESSKCVVCRDYEANIRDWIEQLGGNPDEQYISLELERLIDAVASSSQSAAPIAPAAEDQARKLYQGRAAYDFIKRGTFQTDGFAVTVAGHVIAECEDSEVADWISKQWNAAERKEGEAKHG